MPDHSHILVRIQARHGFQSSMSKEEENIMGDHFQYLKQVLADGKLLLAGPALDDTFGYLILKTTSLEEAELIMDGDPSVISGIMKPLFSPLRVSLLDCD